MSPLEDHEHTRLRVCAALALREAIEDFNARAVTPETIDRLRERMLLVADELAPPVPATVRGDAMLADPIELSQVRRA